jgi:hypothetical protein
MRTSKLCDRSSALDQKADLVKFGLEVSVVPKPDMSPKTSLSIDWFAIALLRGAYFER